MPTAAILNQERERWARNQNKTLVASTTATSGAVVKKTQIPIAASSASFSGSVLKKTLATLSAVGAAFNGSLIKKTLAVLSATGAAFNGSLVKKTSAVLSAVGTAISGSIVKKTFIPLAATVSALSGSIKKKILVILSAVSLALNAVIISSHLHILALVATVAAFNGRVVKKTQRSLSAISFALSGTQAKKTFRSLVAISTAFSGSINKLIKKFYNALLTAWNAAVIGVKTHPVPSVFKPMTVGSSTLTSFGTSEITTFSPNTQMFFGTVTPKPTADGWGNLGQQAMGSQLLVAPGNGGLSDREYFVVLGGDVTIPSDATGVNFSVTVFQNYFTEVAQSIISSSDTLSVSVIPTTVGAIVTWSAVIRLRGNGSHSGFLQADTLVGNAVTQSLSFNRNPNAEPKLQLSAGINLRGVSSQVPKVRLLQFEIQRN